MQTPVQKVLLVLAFLLLNVISIQSSESVNHQKHVSLDTEVRHANSEKELEHLATSQLENEPTSEFSSYSTTVYSTRTKHKSSPLGDVICSIILNVLAFPLLWLNERRYVKTQRRLIDIQKIVKETTPLEVNPNLNNQLVYANGQIFCSEVVYDPILKQQVNNSVWLERKTEMYQWVEHSHTRREGNRSYTYYTYTLEWKEKLIDSNDFHASRSGLQSQYFNDPTKYLLKYEKFYAGLVQFGAFHLSPKQKELCCNHQPIIVTDVITQQAQSSMNISKVHHPFIHIDPSQKYLMFSQQQGGLNAGDFRVSFNYVPCDKLTIVSQQIENTFKTFKLKEGFKTYKQNNADADLDSNITEDNVDLENKGCCSTLCKPLSALVAPIREVDWVYEKQLTLQEVFKDQQSKNVTKTVLTRLLGWFMMVLGWFLLFSPIYKMLSWFPLLGQFLVQLGYFLGILIALVNGTVLSILVISIAWLYYRPKIGLLMLGCCLLIIGYVVWDYNLAGRPNL